MRRQTRDNVLARYRNKHGVDLDDLRVMAQIIHEGHVWAKKVYRLDKTTTGTIEIASNLLRDLLDEVPASSLQEWNTMNAKVVRRDAMMAAKETGDEAVRIRVPAALVHQLTHALIGRVPMLLPQGKKDVFGLPVGGDVLERKKLQSKSRYPLHPWVVEQQEYEKQKRLERQAPYSDLLVPDRVTDEDRFKAIAYQGLRCKRSLADVPNLPGRVLRIGDRFLMVSKLNMNSLGYGAVYFDAEFLCASSTDSWVIELERNLMRGHMLELVVFKDLRTGEVSGWFDNMLVRKVEYPDHHDDLGVRVKVEFCGMKRELHGKTFDSKYPANVS